MLIFDRTEKPETLPEETIYAERELPRWNLQVESWTAGEKREISEERRAGIVTREVYYETKKTMIDAGETELQNGDRTSGRMERRRWSEAVYRFHER